MCAHVALPTQNTDLIVGSNWDFSCPICNCYELHKFSSQFLELELRFGNYGIGNYERCLSFLSDHIGPLNFVSY